MAREVCQMAREICGGNGIILDYRVMKCLMDVEAIHTYEGTYEVNMLVSGREITGGLNAIKKWWFNQQAILEFQLENLYLVNDWLNQWYL